MEWDKIKILYKCFLKNKMKLKMIDDICYVKSEYIYDWTPIVSGWKFMARYTINKEIV